MKLLVTGREGQLARSIAERVSGYPDLSVEFLSRPQADLAVPGSIAQGIRQSGAELVINAAAYTAVDQAEDEPELARRINADAAGEASEAAAAIGAAIIQVSTDYVFDGSATRPYREDDPVSPLGVYGRTKLSGEDQVRSANPRHAIVRTAWVYSPFGRNFVKSMMAAARDREVLTVVDDQVGSPTSALNLADAVLALADRWRQGKEIGLGSTYHVAGSGSTSWFGLAAHVMDQCRARGLPAARVEPIPTSGWPTRAERPRWSVLDSTRFASDLGFVMPDWKASVAEVVGRLASSSS